jgi:hypothetical protein
MNHGPDARVRSISIRRLGQVAYWAATTIVAAELVVGGVTDVLHLPPFFAILLRLGYPAYVGVILGVWKLLGAMAILAPRLARLKEWAYAGIVFDLTGAAASALAVGGAPSDVAAPLLFTGLVAVSWALRPPARRLSGVPRPSRVPRATG